MLPRPERTQEQRVELMSYALQLAADTCRAHSLLLDVSVADDVDQEVAQALYVLWTGMETTGVQPMDWPPRLSDVVLDAVLIKRQRSQPF